MEKTLAWVFGIIAVLGLAFGITMIVMWKKEKDKNKSANTGAGTPPRNAGTSVAVNDNPTGTAAGTVARFSN